MDEDSLLKALDSLMLDRSHTEEELQKNRDYHEAENEFRNIFDCLKTYLPDEQKDGTPHVLLRNYSDLKDSLLSVAVECGYRQGFSEGIRFLIHSLLIK